VSVKGGVVGGVLGLIVQLVIAEWIWVDWFGHHGFLEGVLIVALVGGGAFLGSWLLRLRVDAPNAHRPG
jgi:hypothetical protein